MDIDNNGQQWTTMHDNGQQWTTMDNIGQQWTTIRGVTCISDAVCQTTSITITTTWMVIHHKFIKLIIKSVIMINIMIINIVINITMRLVTGVNLQPPSPCQPASPNLPTSLLQINRLCVIVIVISRDALIEEKWYYVAIFLIERCNRCRTDGLQGKFAKVGKIGKIGLLSF